MSRTDVPASAATSRRPAWCSPRAAATRSRASAICLRRCSWSTSLGIRSPYSPYGPFPLLMVRTYHKKSHHTEGGVMLAPKAAPGTWVSDAAREKFMTAYDRAFALWPQPYEEFDMETATTTTRVHAYR